VKIGDFGISKTLENTQDMAKTVVGTPLYCSPEICLGKAYGPKSDVWSLGCILYEMLALTKPFNGSSMAEIMRKIIARQPDPIPRQCSTEIKSLVMSLLRKKPEGRPNINEVLQLPLIRNKAVALLGKTLAKVELNHGVFHGLKPGESPNDGLDEIKLVIEKKRESRSADMRAKAKAGIYREMKRMADNLREILQGAKSVPEVPDEVEDLNSGEFYFMGRTLSLKMVHPYDPLQYKLESLRAFLEDMIGIEKFKEIYDSASSSDEEGKIRALEMTQSDLYIFQLTMQLVAYENVHALNRTASSM
jgi:NIMA (never in mitosis gene a)-related kinase